MKRINHFFSLIIFFYFCLLNVSFAEIKNKIVMTIGNEIITNYDIKNEIKYLNVVGKEGLQLLTQDEIKKIAIESLVNERIKSNEIANYTNIVITDELDWNILNSCFI